MHAPFKIQSWDEAAFKKNLVPRLAHAKKYRKDLCEDTWKSAELCYYNASLQPAAQAQINYEDLASIPEDDLDGLSREVAINYIYRDVKYMHAQMSSNPPTVKIIPNGTDLDDEDRADAADIVCRWAGEQFNLQEVADDRNLKTLTKGTGYIRYTWDATLGRILAFGPDPEHGLEEDEFLMSGDHRIYSPSTWNIWLDPAAKSSDPQAPNGVRWFFELIEMPLEEANLRFPDKKEEMKKLATGKTSGRSWKFFSGGDNKAATSGDEDRVEVYLYIERGEAVNGMKGRQAYMLEDGCILEFGANENPIADLGLDILTDIDVEDQVYGKSIIEYLESIQQMIQTLDANTLRNIAVHGNIRMACHTDTEFDDETITDDSVDIIRYSGQMPPTFLNTPAQMPDAWRLRDQLHAGSREVSMINEAMLGNTSRETSGYTFQSQINAGNLGRRRLFNKYTISTKRLFRWGVLAIAIENWTEDRVIRVLGLERSTIEEHAFSSTDIDGGWDVQAAYGQSFSLDPSTARDQIMQMMPLFEKLPGFDFRALVDAIRMNVMDNFVDHMALAKRRQREIFKKMIRSYTDRDTAQYIEPRELEDHANMITYCRQYTMSAEYNRLDDDLKSIIDQHIKAREDIVAEQVAATSQAPPGAPAGPPQAPMM